METRRPPPTALPAQINCVIVIGMDDTHQLQKATNLARKCLAGELSALQTARGILEFIGPGTPVWDALNGSSGPLSTFFAAYDEADRQYFLGAEVERWHPDVRERKRAELADAETEFAPDVHAACRALIEYAGSGSARGTVPT